MNYGGVSVGLNRNTELVAAYATIREERAAAVRRGEELRKAECDVAAPKERAEAAEKALAHEQKKSAAAIKEARGWKEQFRSEARRAANLIERMAPTVTVDAHLRDQRVRYRYEGLVTIEAVVDMTEVAQLPPGFLQRHVPDQMAGHFRAHLGNAFARLDGPITRTVKVHE